MRQHQHGSRLSPRPKKQQPSRGASCLVLLVLAVAGCGDDGGAAVNAGDRDADGVADEIDLCPGRPGPGPVGCPLLAFEPVTGPSGTLVYIAGNNFTTDSIARFGHLDALTIFVNNQILLAVVPFADPASLQPQVASEVTIQVDGTTALQRFDIVALAPSGRPAGTVLADAGVAAAAELDDLWPELDAALTSARNLVNRQPFIDLVATSVAARDAVRAALSDLATLAAALPAGAVDVLERLLLAQPTTSAALTCDGGDMDRLLCARVAYAARVARSRALQRVLCGAGQVVAARDAAQAPMLAESCAVAGFTDLLGSFVLVPEVTGVELEGPQAIEVGETITLSPTLTVNHRPGIDLFLERLVSQLVAVTPGALATPAIDAWYRAVGDSIYYWFWELTQNNQRSGPVSAANLRWWAASPELQLFGDGRAHLVREPAFAPILLTAELDPTIRTADERRRELLVPCTQSTLCRAAALGVGAQLATLELSELSCERTAGGLRVAVTGTASGPVAASFAAYVSTPADLFSPAATTDCGGWGSDGLSCSRAPNHPELMIFDYQLECSDTGTPACPQLPTSLQINAVVRDVAGVALASRSAFVACIELE